MTIEKHLPTETIYEDLQNPYMQLRVSRIEDIMLQMANIVDDFHAKGFMLDNISSRQFIIDNNDKIILNTTEQNTSVNPRWKYNDNSSFENDRYQLCMTYMEILTYILNIDFRHLQNTALNLAENASAIDYHSAAMQLSPHDIFKAIFNQLNQYANTYPQNLKNLLNGVEAYIFLCCPDTSKNIQAAPIIDQNTKELKSCLDKYKNIASKFFNRSDLGTEEIPLQDNNPKKKPRR